MLNHLRCFCFGLSGSLLLLGWGQGMVSTPSHAAETIYLKYGGFGRSISVADLRQFIETDEAPRDLAPVLGLVSSKQQVQLKSLLKTQVPKQSFGVVKVDKLLRSPIGEQLLPKFAEVMPLPGEGEIVALRSAIVLAAASENGLGGLSFLEAYPTPNMTINLIALQKLLKDNSGLGSLLRGGF
jgi:hypothetical protein